MQVLAKAVAGRNSVTVNKTRRLPKIPKTKDKGYYPTRQAKTCTKNSPHRTRSYTASAAAEEEAGEWSVAAEESIGIDWALGKGDRMSAGESQGNNTMTEASRGSSDMSMAQMFMAMMQEQQRQREEDRRREEEREERRLQEMRQFEEARMKQEAE